MKVYISPEMQGFLTPGVNEEAVDQPLYDIQTYAVGGATTFTFFATSIGSAANGLSQTNMDAQSVLSAGKRFGIFGISVAFLAGPTPTQVNAAAAASYLNDAKAVLEGIGHLKLVVLDKTYLTEAPLLRVPAGMGLNTGAGGVSLNQAAAADKQNLVSYASNGLPVIANRRSLRVPLPIPQQVRFEVSINFPAAIAVGTAGRIGVWLDGMLIRAKQ